jgi:hypothetical protein
VASKAKWFKKAESLDTHHWGFKSCRGHMILYIQEFIQLPSEWFVVLCMKWHPKVFITNVKAAIRLSVSV